MVAFVPVKPCIHQHSQHDPTRPHDLTRPTTIFDTHQPWLFTAKSLGTQAHDFNRNHGAMALGGPGGSLCLSKSRKSRFPKNSNFCERFVPSDKGKKRLVKPSAPRSPPPAPTGPRPDDFRPSTLARALGLRWDHAPLPCKTRVFSL